MISPCRRCANLLASIEWNWPRQEGSKKPSQGEPTKELAESGRQTLPPRKTVCRIPGNSPFDLLTIITHIRWPLIFCCCRAIRINISASQLDFRFSQVFVFIPTICQRKRNQVLLERKRIGLRLDYDLYGPINNHQKESQ